MPNVEFYENSRRCQPDNMLADEFHQKRCVDAKDDDVCARRPTMLRRPRECAVGRG